MINKYKDKNPHEFVYFLFCSVDQHGNQDYLRERSITSDNFAAIARHNRMIRKNELIHLLPFCFIKDNILKKN